MQEDHTTKQMLEQFADLAGKKVHVEKRSLVGAQLEAFGAAVRQDDVHLLAIAVSALAAVVCAIQLQWAPSLVYYKCMDMFVVFPNHNLVTVEFSVGWQNPCCIVCSSASHCCEHPSLLCQCPCL